MQTYPIHEHEGPLTIEIGGEFWVVDTGSPITQGQPSRLLFSGCEFGVGRDYWPAIRDSLEQGFGLECAGLIGNDVLSQFDLLIDLVGHTLTVSEHELDLSGIAVPIELRGGPTFTAIVGDTSRRVVFDTGAHIPYLHPDIAPDKPAKGRVVDYHPIHGRFESDIFDVRVDVAGEYYCVRFGVLPPQLAVMLAYAGAQAVIGTDLCQRRVVGYFPRRGFMVLGK